jgi:hypothetical protein
MFQALIEGGGLLNFEIGDRMISVPAAFEQPAIASK